MYHFAYQIPAFIQAFILASVVAIVALLHHSLRRLVKAQPFLWKATEYHETGIKNFTLSGLTMVQVWRIFPETIILLLIQNGIMPEGMTFTGRNFDIFAPLTAPLMAMMIRRESPAAGSCSPGT